MDTQDTYTELKTRMAEASVNSPGDFSFTCEHHFTSDFGLCPAANPDTKECGSGKKGGDGTYTYDCDATLAGWRRICKLRATRTRDHTQLKP